MIHQKENRVPLPASGPISYLYPNGFRLSPTSRVVLALADIEGGVETEF